MKKTHARFGIGAVKAGFGALALALGLVACGDDGSTNRPSNNHEGSNVSSVTSEDDLPSCTESRDGSVSFINGTKEGFVCKDRKWVHYDMIADVEENLPGCIGSREGLTVYLYEENRELKCVDGVWEKIGEEAGSSSSVTPNSSSSVILSESEGSSSSVVSSSSVESSSSVASSSSSSSTPIEDLSSSSSIKVPEPAEGSSSSKANWAYLNSDIDYGEFTDARDGQVYKTVTIGTQTWMAENLNYRYVGVKYNYSGFTSDSTSWCYDNDPSKCATYGRLYTWAAAVDSVAVYEKYGEECGFGKSCTRFSASALAKESVRGVCASGWHLPSDAEWSALYTNVGGTDYAAQKLKANTSLWTAYSGVTNDDSFGFAVLPAGYRDGVGSLCNEGDYAGFWSSTEGSSNGAYSWNFGYYNDLVDYGCYGKGLGFSVRCLKD